MNISIEETSVKLAAGAIRSAAAELGVIASGDDNELWALLSPETKSEIMLDVIEKLNEISRPE